MGSFELVDVSVRSRPCRAEAATQTGRGKRRPRNQGGFSQRRSRTKLLALTTVSQSGPGTVKPMHASTTPDPVPTRDANRSLATR
jgi:hypothetical protein